MKYPYDFTFTLDDTILNIYIKQGNASNTISVFGIDSTFNITDEKVQGFLDMMLTDAIEHLSQYPTEVLIPDDLQGSEDIYESITFMEKLFPIMPKEDLKPLLVRLWGSKK